MASNDASLCVAGLDPVLEQLGEMVGLLKTDVGGAGDSCIDPGWFEDPIASTSSGIKSNPEAFAELLDTLLGGVAGHALGVPAKDPGLLGSWYPIPNPTTQQPTGLYLVSYPDPAESTDYVFGLGLLHQWKVPSSDPVLEIDAFGLIPLVKLGGEALTPVIGTRGYPITLGVSAVGTRMVDGQPQPLVEAGEFSFNGVKFGAAVDVAASDDPFQLSIVVLSLRLPEDQQPADRSLADLLSITSEQIIETAASLLVTALSEVLGDAPDGPTQYLLPIFGLSSTFPGSSKFPALPPLRWDRLLSSHQSDDVGAPFRDWFRAIAADSGLVKAWLTAIGGFTGNPAIQITGSGSRSDPQAAPLLSVKDVGVLSFTVGTRVDDAGTRSFYPGLSFSAEPIELKASSGTVDAALTLAANLELAEFVLATSGGFAIPSSLSFAIGFTLAGGTAGKPLVTSNGYGCDRLQGGLSLGSAGGTLRVVPLFELTGVQIPGNALGTVNLLSPASLSDAASATLSSAIESALDAIFDLTGDAAAARGAAALLGIVPPVTTGWTIDPPFSGSRLTDTLADPVAALGKYYQDVVNAPAVGQGERPFTQMLGACASLLSLASTSVAITVTGSGTEADPWMASLQTQDATMPAHLVAWTCDDDGSVETLSFGLTVAPVVAVGQTKVVPTLFVQLLDLAFDAQGLRQGIWLPGLNVDIELPNGFESPAIADAVLAITSASLAARWRRSGGWFWSLTAGQPSLTLGNEPPMAIGKDLNFGDQASLDELVTSGAETFAPIFLGLMGVSLLRAETRPGLALTALAGLLPDVSGAPNYPSGLNWPAVAPLAVTDLFTDPRQALRDRINALFASQETASAASSLLSWTLSPSLTTAPTIAGSATFDAPLRLPIGSSGFDALLWHASAGPTLGLGLGRIDVQTFGSRLEVTASSRLNAIEVSLATGAIETGGDAPSAAFVATLSNPNGPLVPSTLGGELGALELGFSLMLADGVVEVIPVVTLLAVQLPGSSKRDQLTLADFLAPSFGIAAQQAYLALLNDAVVEVSKSAATADSFKTIYTLLVALGLANPRPKAESAYGINPGGWSGLLADPTGFVTGKLTELLEDSTLRDDLFALAEGVLGIEIPTPPAPVLALLDAFGFIGPEAQGYPILPAAVMALAHAPFETLRGRAEAVATDPAKRATLVAALAGDTRIGFPESQPLFEMSLVAGTRIQVVTANQVFVLGGVLDLAGGLEFNLADLALSVSADLNLLPVGLTLESALGARFGPGASAPSFAVELTWGARPNLPAPVPLTVFPFHGETFVKQVTALAPVYALDICAGAALQSEFIQDYPLPRIILQGLGLVTGPANGPWKVPALSGLLRDPSGWLLADEVLGDQGRLSLAAFGNILSRLGAAAPNGWESPNQIKVMATNAALEVSGLPYGLAVSVAVDATELKLTTSTGGFRIGGNSASLKTLSAGITLGADYQPGFVGGVELGSTTDPGWFVRAGFKDAFALTIGQGQSDSPAGFQLDILPFQGWGNLAEQATRVVAPQLLEKAVPELVSGLANNDSTKAFAQRLQTLGTGLDLKALVDQLAAVSPFTAENIEQAALTWLLGRFDEQNKAATATTLVSLFADLVPAGAFSAAAGLVVYQPSDQIPVRFKIGADEDDNLGLWVGLDPPANLPVKAAITSTGIGIPLTGSPTPVFSFGVTVTVPVDGSVGPQLGLHFADGKLVMGLDPLGDSAAPGTHSALYRELFPDFFPPRAGQSDPLDTRVLDWTTDVVTQVLPRYVSVVLLNLEPVHTWLDTPVLTSGEGPTPALILVDTQLITKSTDASKVTYALNSVENLLAIEPLAFLANLIKALLSEDITVAQFDDGKGLVTVGKSPVNDHAYGVRFAVSDLAFEKLPYVVFQLGATDKDWIKHAGGNLGKLSEARGLSAYVPVSGEGTDIRPHFDQVELNLINVGLDLVGKAGKPIIDLSRFQLGAVKPRGLVAMTLADGASVTAYGGAATLTDMMLSLAPNTLTEGGGGNPIAQNLLGSGTSAAVNNPPPNPSFSLTTGYVKDQAGDGGLYVQLEGGDAGDNKVVVRVQRSFGPLYIGSVGLGWEDKDYLLDVLFTGSVALAGLEADLIGLTIGIPVKTITDPSRYQLGLDGLDLSFNGGPVTITGGLLKTEKPELMYTGAALVKAATFSIVAVGSYSQVPTGVQSPAKSPSLFIFGALNTPLGGPPFFFIKGVAAGFGYNRALKLPSVGTVQDFPLVAGVKNGSFTEGEDANSVLEVLNDQISPAIGEYWVAAGLRFSTYELLDTLALLFVKFGREFEVDLIGLSSAALPPEIPKDQALAYIELAIKVTINPAVGYFSAEAQLTPNSFLITKDCKLTGGFAFYLWFKDQTAPDGAPILAGDFVITLGGYHPAFKVPSYYPVVPRLGFKWLLKVGDVGEVDIDGGAYFALVPTAIMAGGNLNLVFTMGPIKAWLLAAANFLIEWQPFYYDVQIKVSIGVSFHTRIAGVSITLSVSLGADLHLMGPPTHGYAKVSWYVISFTIPIGDDKSVTGDASLDWHAFSERLLPPAKPASDAPAPRLMAVADVPAVIGDSPPGQQVIKVAAASGLVDGPGKDAANWKFRPVPFSINLTTAIPVSTLSVTGLADVTGSPRIGVRPMGKTTALVAPLTIEILDHNQEPINLKERRLSSVPATTGAPSALWSRDGLDTGHAPQSDDMVIGEVLLSTRIEATDSIRIGTLGQFPIINLAYDQADGRLPYFLTPKYPASVAYSKADQQRALALLQATVMDSGVVTTRNAILAALRSIGFAAPTNPDLSVTATSAGAVLQAPPTLARIGLYQTGGVVASVAPVVESPPMRVQSRVMAVAPEPELIGVRRTYVGARTADQRPADAGARRSWTRGQSRRKPRRMVANLRLAKAGQPAERVFDGTLFAWRVADDIAYQVDHQGDLSVRTICLDKHGDLLADQMADPGAHELPRGTRTLSVEGYAEPTADVIVGWDRGSVLTKLSGSVAVGHRCTVRMQNGARVRRRGRRVESGLICAGLMMQQNAVQSAGGQLVPGWVKTCFGEPVASFAVTLPASQTPIEDRVVVTLTQGDEPGEREAVAAVPVRIQVSEEGYHTVAIYALARTSRYTTVMVRPLNALAAVEGVVASHACVDDLADALGQHELATAALDPLADRVPRSTLMLRSLGPTA